jgi:hypothetical protein
MPGRSGLRQFHRWIISRWSSSHLELSGLFVVKSGVTYLLIYKDYTVTCLEKDIAAGRMKKDHAAAGESSVLVCHQAGIDCPAYVV